MAGGAPSAPLLLTPTVMPKGTGVSAQKPCCPGESLLTCLHPPFPQEAGCLVPAAHSAGQSPALALWRQGSSSVSWEVSQHRQG